MYFFTRSQVISTVTVVLSAAAVYLAVSLDRIRLNSPELYYQSVNLQQLDPKPHCQDCSVSPIELINLHGTAGDLRVLYYQSFPRKINVNSATPDLLTIVPGLSDIEASLIVEERENNGLFGSLAELSERTGIDHEKIISCSNSLAFYKNR